MKTTKSVAETITKSAASSHRTSVRISGRFVTYRRVLTLAAGLTFCLAAATARAQALPSYDSTQAPVTTSAGWWSLESASSTSPRFLLSVAGLPNFKAFDSANTSIALSGANIPAEPMANYIANLTDAGSLPSVPFLSIIQTSYVQWESGIADTRTPTSANGAMVYPMMEINYASGQLPVALYVSPLR